MGRRLLSLPLAILLAVLLLLGALTAAGGLPTTIAIPLISGIVAAMLSGGLALIGIWMTMRYQIDRDRVDRLREAYGKLLRAGVKVVDAHAEVRLFPRGRPYQGLIAPMMSDEAQRDFARYNPHEVLERLVDQAQDFFTEAEVVIYSDEGPDSPALGAWKQLAKTFERWRVYVVSELPTEAAELEGQLQTDILSLRQATHQQLSKLARS